MIGRGIPSSQNNTPRPKPTFVSIVGLGLNEFGACWFLGPHSGLAKDPPVA
jgi:hypothetical protein